MLLLLALAGTEAFSQEMVRKITNGAGQNSIVRTLGGDSLLVCRHDGRDVSFLIVDDNLPTTNQLSLNVKFLQVTDMQVDKTHAVFCGLRSDSVWVVGSFALGGFPYSPVSYVEVPAVNSLNHLAFHKIGASPWVLVAAEDGLHHATLMEIAFPFSSSTTINYITLCGLSEQFCADDVIVTPRYVVVSAHVVVTGGLIPVVPTTDARLYFFDRLMLLGSSLSTAVSKRVVLTDFKTYAPVRLSQLSGNNLFVAAAVKEPSYMSAITRLYVSRFNGQTSVSATKKLTTTMGSNTLQEMAYDAMGGKVEVLLRGTLNSRVYTFDENLTGGTVGGHTFAYRLQSITNDSADHAFVASGTEVDSVMTCLFHYRNNLWNTCFSSLSATATDAEDPDSPQSNSTAMMKITNPVGVIDTSRKENNLLSTCNSK